MNISINKEFLKKSKSKSTSDERAQRVILSYIIFIFNPLSLQEFQDDVQENKDGKQNMYFL